MNLSFINIAHAGVITDAPTFQTVGMNVLYSLLSIAGIFAMIALVLSGGLYFFSAGDEKRMQVAKRTALYAILGIILAMSGLVVVRLVGGLL